MFLKQHVVQAAGLRLAFVLCLLIAIDLNACAAEERAHSSVEFILDCSQSMGELSAVKNLAIGGRQTAPRLSQAKQQLKTVLDELVARNRDTEEIQVGVRFFGHRVGWENGIPNSTMLVQNGNLNNAAKLKQLGPSRDVELALPLGKFDDTNNAKIKRRIDRLEPWGETPTFLALKQALADFPVEPSASRKCIIAITDGENSQSNSDTFLKDVVETWQTNKVPINVLAFDPVANARNAARDYDEIAHATGGKFVVVRDGDALLDALRQFIPPRAKKNSKTPL